MKKMQVLNESFCLSLPSPLPIPRHLTSWKIIKLFILLNGRRRSSFSLHGHDFTKLVGASLSKRIKLLSQVWLEMGIRLGIYQ